MLLPQKLAMDADVLGGAGERYTMRLRDYADAIVQATHDHDQHTRIVLNPDSGRSASQPPHAMMAWVTLLVAQRLWGDLSTWRLDGKESEPRVPEALLPGPCVWITPAAWHDLQSRMACTEWCPCIATRQEVPGLTCRASQALEGYWLWQEDDLPDVIRPKYLVHLDLMLWVCPVWV